jgi:hypothetical protein
VRSTRAGRPARHGRDAEAEAEEDQHDQAQEVLPRLRVAADDARPAPEPRSGRVAVASLDALSEQESGTTPLEAREEAVHVNASEEDGDAEQRDEQHRARDEDRELEREGDHAERESERQVGELAPGLQPNRPEHDGR